jgi:hypothetical protein
MQTENCPECGYPVPPEGKLREWNGSAKEYCPCQGGTQCLCRQIAALRADAAQAARIISQWHPLLMNRELKVDGQSIDALIARLRGNAAPSPNVLATTRIATGSEPGTGSQH